MPVAKHGNRALSSKSGSADVLTALGVNIDADLAIVRRCLWEIGIGFLMAPRHHSAMRHVAPTRVELGTRTIFNLLGPLSNPAGARRQLVGVFAPEWVRPMAEVLGRLGAERAWVVHGAGLDELTTAGTTTVAELKDGKVENSRSRRRMPGLKPRDARRAEGRRAGAQRRADARPAGRRARPAARHRAAEQRRRADRRRPGRQRCATAPSSPPQSIDSGAARRVLDRLVAVTNGRDPVSDVLAEICDESAQHVARRKAARSEAALRDRARRGAAAAAVRGGARSAGRRRAATG